MPLQLKDLLNKDSESHIPGNIPTLKDLKDNKMPLLSTNIPASNIASLQKNSNLMTPPGSDIDKSHSDEDITTTNNSNSNNNSPLKEPLICQWDQCHLTFLQAELLYHHLCQDHVGRKSKKNLQLNCHWNDCKTKTDKRDHITSHLRVHIPLKPFNCANCHKSFKRPQDLKKHIKIHLESNTLLRKKRGPKIGTKRINKLSIQQQNNNNNNNNLHSFIRNDLHSLEPVLTSNLKNKLQTFLPLPQVNTNTYSSVSNSSNSSNSSACTTPGIPTETPPSQAYQDDNRKLSNSSIIFSPVGSSSSSESSNSININNNTLDHQQFPPSATKSYISSPTNTSILTSFDNIPRNDIQTAATFFTKLSHNMMLKQQQQQQYQYVPLQQAIPIYNTTANNINANANVVYPMIPHLPPIGQQQFVTASPSIQYQQQQQQQQQYNNTALPPISTLPVLQPRLHFQMPSDTISQQLTPNHNIINNNTNSSNATYYKQYSVYQMNNGQSSSSDEGDDHDDDFVPPLRTDEDDMLLDSVNLIKDYLICSLLEEDFESESEMGNEMDNDKEIESLTDDFAKTLKYPKIVI